MTSNPGDDDGKGLAGPEDIKVNCRANSALTQVQLLVSNGQQELEATHADLVEARGRKRLWTRVLEGPKDEFEGTRLLANDQLSVVFELVPKGERGNLESNRIGVDQIDLERHRVHLNLTAVETKLYTIESTDIDRFSEATGGAYVRDHPKPPPPEPEPGWIASFLKKLREGLIDNAAKLVIGLIGLGALALLVWLGLRTPTIETTETAFWSPPLIPEASWSAEAEDGTCLRMSSLAGKAYACSVVDSPERIVPCFQYAGGRFVCANDPWSDPSELQLLVTDVTTSTTTSTSPAETSSTATSVQSGPESLTLLQQDVWAVELVDGRRCLLDFEVGATRFRCASNEKLIATQGTTSLAGIAGKSDGVWNLLVRTGSTQSERVDIKKAWGVFLG